MQRLPGLLALACGLWAVAATYCLAPPGRALPAGALAPCPAPLQAALGGSEWVLLWGPEAPRHEANLARLAGALGALGQQAVGVGVPEAQARAWSLKALPEAEAQALGACWREAPRPSFVRVGAGGAVLAQHAFLPGAWCGPGLHPSVAAMLRGLGTPLALGARP